MKITPHQCPRCYFHSATAQIGYDRSYGEGG